LYFGHLFATGGGPYLRRLGVIVFTHETDLRKSDRYPLRLPVQVRTAHAQLIAQSENISMGGMLFNSRFRIREGSVVELAIDLQGAPESSILITARGTVLRVATQPSGEYATAVAFDAPPKFTHQGGASQTRH
jgi:hypothetical protein